MDVTAFNQCLDELTGRLQEAFPDLQELASARMMTKTIIDTNPNMPLQLFCEHMRPHVDALQTRDLQFLEQPSSPLQPLGLLEAWKRMHPITRDAVVGYLDRLVGYSGLLVERQAMSLLGVKSTGPGAPPINPAAISDIFQMAQAATCNLSEDDARALLERRDSQKLGDLCFNILDIMTKSQV
ncbi:hypothetical protein GHT06_003845 [Daphnia sinensis]|uniref:Uncharacterized protein n=1 Tax=Daphnia sinensis TaxID=1820382 RepID=A0AAD5PM21_9CRUS|nr:hypothetical protein GHT06_003845 [Daphnia sinensis]